MLPKLLICTINVWQDGGIVNTLPDILRAWEPDRIAQIYTRSELPNISVCNRFFQIPESAVLRSVFHPFKTITGRRVHNTKMSQETEEQKQEKARYAAAAKKHSWLLTLCREGVWLLGHWKTKALDRFITEETPDVLFLPVYPTVYMGWIQRYLIKKTKLPAVCYLADDNYSYRNCGCNPLAYLHRFLLRRQVKKIVSYCGQLFVIVDKQKEEYDRLFHKNSVILTKGINEEKDFIPPKAEQPIRMLYTGSLLIGRDETLGRIADAMERINVGETRLTLDVYSRTPLKEAYVARLNRNGCTFRGGVDSETAQQLQKEADVVVFVEAMEGRESNAARLSFSTKLTEYMSSGKCILAVGREDIAPMEYLKKNDAAVLATSLAEITQALEWLIKPGTIGEYAEKAFLCGKRNHNRGLMQQRLLETILREVEAHTDQ